MVIRCCVCGCFLGNKKPLNDLRVIKSFCSECKDNYKLYIEACCKRIKHE